MGEEASKKGLRCPKCGSGMNDTFMTEHKTFNVNNQLVNYIYRRRKCCHCGTTFQSREEVVKMLTDGEKLKKNNTASEAPPITDMKDIPPNPYI